MLEEGKDYTISGLYYNYMKVSDNDIRKYLQNIKICHLTDKGVGSIHGYYSLNQKSMDKIIKNPRGVSLTFQATETDDQPLTNLFIYKEIIYLVKSTSRFFLKPDVGEIFDQINFRDLFTPQPFIKAICFNDGYDTLPNTDGEHFLMTATLLVNEDKDKEDAIRKLHSL